MAEKNEKKEEEKKESEKKIETKEEQEKQELLAKSEISLWLDTYDDIFSDFDPRPYSQRALSDDFLVEAKKATRELKTGQLELRFLIPVAIRDVEKEIIIRKRLREHFKKYAHRLKLEKLGMIKQGALLIFFGIIMMFLATFILFQEKKNFVLSFLIILLEPAAWFSFWEGAYLLVFKVKEKNPDLEFYEKMSKAEFVFCSY
jgi:hypothetical protein